MGPDKVVYTYNSITLEGEEDRSSKPAWEK
jgi:hypothetical protein